MNHFKGKQFQKDVIIISVGYYLRYNLSYRDVQEMLYDRGINVSHTTIYRWVQEYGKLKSKLIACGYYGIISLVEKLRRWLSLKGGDAYESKHQNL